MKIWKYTLFNLFILFLLLFFTWIVLSGFFSAFFLTLGALSCLVAVIFYRVIYKDKINFVAILLVRMIYYSLWLMKEVAKSSLDVSLKMWQLDPEISPQVLWVSSNLHEDIPVAIYANSITLTPGTVTIGTREGMLYIHSLTGGAMDDLKRGDMLARVKKVTKFGDK